MNAKVSKIENKASNEKPVKLSPARLKSAEFVRNTYVARTEGDFTIEDIIDPNYWSHVSAKFKAGDHIEVVSASGNKYAELYVVACGPNYAKVMVINSVEAESKADTDEATVDNPDYTIKWGGVTDKFRVIYTPDNKVISANHDTKLDASKWLVDYIAAMNK